MRLALAALLCLLSAPAFAAPVNATYGLYTGGVKMIDVKATLDFKPDSYHMRTEASTIGIFAKLLPWSGVFDTLGVSEFQPSKHDYTVKWRGDSETLSFAYAPAGKLTSVTKIEGDKKTDETPDSDVAQGTRDMLSAVGMVLKRYESTGKCAGDTLAFDGKRSLTIQTRDVGTVTLNNPKLSSYTGPAHGCSIKIVQGKGKWPKKPRGWMKIQQMGEKEGKLPVLWIARPSAEGPVIPVRIDIHTKFGDVIAHLTSVQ